MINSRQSPISPPQMLKRLLMGSFEDIESVQQSQNIKQQTKILVQLNKEYQSQISEAQKYLYEIKEKLIYQLQSLQKQQQAIQLQTFQSIQVLKTTPIALAQQSSYSAEITQIRQLNSKLRIRIEDMSNYLQKLQQQNARLETERKIINVKELDKVQTDQSWRNKINVLKNQPLSYQIYHRDLTRNKYISSLIKIQNEKQLSQQSGKLNPSNKQNSGYFIDPMNSSNAYSLYRYI